MAEPKAIDLEQIEQEPLEAIEGDYEVENEAENEGEYHIWVITIRPTVAVIDHYQGDPSRPRYEWRLLETEILKYITIKIDWLDTEKDFEAVSISILFRTLRGVSVKHIVKADNTLIEIRSDV